MPIICKYKKELFLPKHISDNTKPSSDEICQKHKNIYKAGTAGINAFGDSRLRGRRSKKPIGYRQWVVHKTIY